MPWTPTKSDSGSVFTIRPIGPGGVDVFTEQTGLDTGVLSRCENIDLQRQVAERRRGAIKVAQLSTPGTQGASRTFGADTKYATFTPPAIPVGGFAFITHFVATLPASGKTAYVLSSRPNGQTYHIIKITLSDAGVITVSWRDNGGSTRTVACDAVSGDTSVHLLAIYDAVAGTFTCYVNGSSSGTPLTGLSSTLKPATDTATWVFGVEKETGASVTADSHFDGKLDGWTLFTLRGTRPASGSTTLVETLRRNSARVWPNPAMTTVLSHYDMDEASGTTMYDRSPWKNHGTYVGTPSSTLNVALMSAPTNVISAIDVPGGKFNLVASFGNLFYEQMSSAVVA